MAYACIHFSSTNDQLKTIQRDIQKGLSFCVVTFRSEPDNHFAAFEIYNKSDEETFSASLITISANSSGFEYMQQEDFEALDSKANDAQFWGSDDCSDVLGRIWGINFGLRR